MEGSADGVTVRDRTALKVPSSPIPDVVVTLEDDDTEGFAELVTEIVAIEVIEGLPLPVDEFVPINTDAVAAVDRVGDVVSDTLIFADIVYVALIELLPLTLVELVYDAMLDTDPLEEREADVLPTADFVANVDFDTDAQAERERSEEDVREIRVDADVETVPDGERDTGGVIDDAADFEKIADALTLRNGEREGGAVRVPFVLLVPVGLCEIEPECEEYRLKVDEIDAEGEDDENAVLESDDVFVLTTETVIVFVPPVEMLIVDVD